MASSILTIKLSTSLPRCEMCKSMARIVFHTDVRASGIVAKSEKHWQTVFDDSKPPGLLDGAEEPPRTYMISARLPRLKPRGAQWVWRKRLQHTVWFPDPGVWNYRYPRTTVARNTFRILRALNNRIHHIIVSFKPVDRL